MQQVTFDEEQWKLRKKHVYQEEERTNVPARPIARVLDMAKDDSSDLRRKRLWNIGEGQWNGPFNLSAPGELQRYLAKRNDQGRLIFLLEPLPSSPAHVAPLAQSTAPVVNAPLGELEALQTKVRSLEEQLAESQRSGRRRHHRGRRRRSSGGDGQG